MSRFLHIGFLIPKSPIAPKTGGEWYNFHLVKGLKERGHAVELLSVEEYLAKGKEASAAGIEEQLRSRKDGFDVLLVDTWLYRFMDQTKPLEKVKGRVVSFHQLCYWESMRSPLARWKERWRMAKAMKGVRHHIGVSKTVLALDGVSRGRCAVVYPGCDLNVPTVEVKGKRAGELRVVSVGNYTSRKGHHKLIEALGRWSRTQREGVKLRIIGNREFDPLYVKKLEEQVESLGLKDQVLLDGWKSREEVQGILLESDAFAFASEGEGFGMVMAEALLHGLPVVVSPLRVFKELLGNNQCGWADGRYGYWLNKLKGTEEAEYNDLRKNASMLGRKLAQPWDVVLDQFEGILKDWRN